MVALEAMSAYSIQTQNTGSTNLTVKLGTPGRQKDYTIILTDSDEGIQKELEVYNQSLFQYFFQKQEKHWHRFSRFPHVKQS